MLSGCRLTLSLDVSMHVDGSSVVQFVVEADEPLAGEVDLDELLLDDLSGSGWDVTGPMPTSDGGASLTLSASGLTPEQVAAVIEQLDDGRLFEVRRAEAVAAVGVTDYALEVEALTDATADDFSDDELRAVLDGRSFGTDRATMEALAGTSLEEAVEVRVRVAVPGAEGTVEDLVIVDLGDDSGATAMASSQVVDERVGEARVDAASARDEVDESWARLLRLWGIAAVLAVVLVVVARLWRGRREVQQPTI